MDIPKIFTISESAHRIHNPFTAQKYATLGQVLRMAPEPASRISAAALARCCALGTRSWNFRRWYRYEPVIQRASHPAGK